MQEKNDVIGLGNIVPKVKLLERTERGVNKTYHGFIQTDTEQIKAYIKLLDGRQLVNELLANMLGRRCGMPVPKGYLIRARPSDLDPAPIISGAATEFLMYGSSDEGIPSLKRCVETKVLRQSGVYDRWEGLAAAATFDDWIANSDRHTGNLLVGTAESIWLIDHGHAFTGSNWTAANLADPAREYSNQLGAHLRSMAQAKRDAAYIKSTECIKDIGAVDVEQAAMRGQLTSEFNLVTDADRLILLEFVRSRVAYLLPIVKKRLGCLI